MAAKWGIDIAAALVNAEKARALPDMSAIWPELFNRPKADTPDVDEDLYGGFVGHADRRRLNQLRELSPAELAVSRVGFDDDRLAELVFRYRARNFQKPSRRRSISAGTNTAPQGCSKVRMVRAMWMPILRRSTPCLKRLTSGLKKFWARCMTMLKWSHLINKP